MKINEIITETDNETVYGRKEDGFVLSPVDPNRPKPIRKRAKWKDDEAKKLRANNAALKAQGKSGGREQGFTLSPVKETELVTSPTKGDPSGQTVRYRKGIDKKTGKEFYQYNRGGHWGRKASTEQSARDDAYRKLAAAGGQPYAGRSQTMDRMAQKMMPHRKKYNMSATDVATMAQIASGGGSVQDWQDRYKTPTQVARPKPGVIGSETTSTSFGKASDIRKPIVKHKKIGQ